MIYGSICSGIEAAHFASDGLGWERKFSSEIEDFPSAVLAHHWPDTPNLGDFTKIKASDWPDVEMICGGPPCQSFSLAGKRGGLNDDRGNLTLNYVDMCHDFATNGSLRWAFYENVPGILSDKTNAFGCLISGLIGGDDPLCPPKADWGFIHDPLWHEVGRDKDDNPVFEEAFSCGGAFGWKSIKWPSQGMASGPRARLAWRLLDAQYFGLAQRRKRVLIVIGFADGCDPAKVLFERASLSRNTPACVLSRKKSANNLRNGSTGRGRKDNGTGIIQYLQSYWFGNKDSIDQKIAEVAPALKANGSPRGDQKGMENSLIPYIPPVSHTLKGEGFDGSEDGSGRGTPIVGVFNRQRTDQYSADDIASTVAARDYKDATDLISFSAKDHGADASYDVAPTLRAGGHDKSHANSGNWPAIAFNSRQDPISGEIAGALDTCSPQAEAVAYDIHSQDSRASEIKDVCNTVTGKYGTGGGNIPVKIDGPHAIRRLTKVECARLQGFPDNHTLIDFSGKKTLDALPDDIGEYALSMGYDPLDKSVIRLFMCPDGPQYKAYGNSWAINKIRFVFRRMDYVDKIARGIDPGVDHLALTEPF